MTVAEIAAIIAGAVTVLGTIGAAIKFVWDKIEARFAHIENELDQCHKREEHNHERRAVHVLVIELLWQEVTRLSPKATSPTLARAKHLLDDLKQFGKDEAV